MKYNKKNVWANKDLTRLRRRLMPDQGRISASGAMLPLRCRIGHAKMGNSGKLSDCAGKNPEIAIDDIVIPEDHRALVPVKVERLKESIVTIGLQAPITVFWDPVQLRSRNSPA